MNIVKYGKCEKFIRVSRFLLCFSNVGMSDSNIVSIGGQEYEGICLFYVISMREFKILLTHEVEVNVSLHVNKVKKLLKAVKSAVLL